MLIKTVKFGTYSEFGCVLFVLKHWSYQKCQNVEVWRRPGRIMSRSLCRQSEIKHVEQSKEIYQKLD